MTVFCVCADGISTGEDDKAETRRDTIGERLDPIGERRGASRGKRDGRDARLGESGCTSEASPEWI